MYSPCPTQWPNGKISDMVYMPIESAPANFPPIIVEVQHTIDLSFMFRIISYYNQLFLQSKKVPIVLIFGISKIKNDTLMNCTICHNYDFLLQYRKETCSLACYLVDRTILAAEVRSLPFDPLLSLSLFLTCKHQYLSSDPFSADPIIQQLYSIAKTIFEDQVRVEDGITDECTAVCKLADEKVNQGLMKLRSGADQVEVEDDLLTAYALLCGFGSKYEQHISPFLFLLLLNNNQAQMTNRHLKNNLLSK